MLKRLVILAMYGALATVGLLASQTAPLSPPKQGIAKPDTGQNGSQQADSQSAQQTAQPGTVLRQPSAPACDENCQQERENLDIERKVEWFTGVLAAVGVLQGVLLYFTWRTIRRQADMQQASMIQWVDIQPIGITVETKSAPDSPEIFSLTLRWKLINNTPLPFTVQRIATRLCKDVRFWEISVAEDTEIIPPAKEGNRNFYPFFVEVDLSELETREFREKGLLLTIQIEISYIDAAGNPKSQSFGDHYSCDKNTLTLGGDWLGKTPEKRIEQDDSPSTIRAEKIQVTEWREVPDPPQEGAYSSTLAIQGPNPNQKPEKPD